MAFTGWPNEAIDFFDGLEEDNSKAYWLAHKATYEESVKRPMEELLAELADEFGQSKIFRPYRDVRFSADKSPYKTAIAATLGEAGYVHLSASGLGVGSGMYHMASDQLDRFRKAVDDDKAGLELNRLVSTVRKTKMDVAAHDSLKTAPKGYAKDHPRVELLRLKGLVTWKEWPAGAWLATRKSKSRLVDALRAAQPINDWLNKHVGTSTMPEPARR
jgi:uncharacterized protein (TIGR02453 family)